jgi:sulfatase maturation enzyme AslB (radical SAM superfamily)
MFNYSKRVYLRVTNRCNKNCDFCFYKNDPKQIGDMPISLLKSLIEKELENCPVNSRLYVEFTGGEPTLYKYLKESLEYLAKDKRLSITVETNCSTLDTSEFIDILDIFRIKDNYLKLSINTSLIASDDN